MGKTVTVGSTVKYGSGEYDSTAHGGKGKAQKLLGPSAGSKGSTPHASSAPVRDGVEGKGDRKRGYQLDAHSETHHGRSGEAVGHKNDLRPMDYDRELRSEGQEGKVGHVGAYNRGGKSAKAEHHPPVPKVAHAFKGSVREAHGYGHSGSQRQGVHRLSGHSKGHMVGKR